MNNKPLRYLIVGALGTTLALASPALAFHGGGGMHVGGMGGGMHFSGMSGATHFSGMSGATHFSGTSGATHFSDSRFASAPFAHAAFSPRFSRFAFRGHDGFHHRFFHHRFHRFAFFGGPYYAYASYDDCWRRVWTSYGPQWVNVCGDYGY
jgi:hypothetical protein